MSVWMKRLSVIFFIAVIFMIAGCDTSVEKPLTKDEASASEVQDAKTREISITADVEPPEMDISQEEQQDKEPESRSEEENTEKQEEESETFAAGSSSSEPESNSENQDSNSTGNKSESSSSNDQEKNANDSSSSKSTNNKSKENSSNQNDNTPKKRANKEKSNESKAPRDTIVISIVISDSEVPLSPTEVEVKEGDSVLDALIRITQEKGIQMDYRGGQGESAYVEGIANVYEFDRGPASGWMYRVNGVFPDRGVGTVSLNADDRVEFLYTKDLGNDLGAN